VKVVALGCFLGSELGENRKGLKKVWVSYGFQT